MTGWALDLQREPVNGRGWAVIAVLILVAVIVALSKRG